MTELRAFHVTWLKVIHDCLLKTLMNPLMTSQV